MLEFIGPTIGGKLAVKLGFNVVKLQTGKVFDYAFFILAVLYYYTVYREATCL